MNKYDGKDNYGKPKSAYLMKIAALIDKKLEDEAENKLEAIAKVEEGEGEYLDDFEYSDTRDKSEWTVEEVK